MRRIVIAETARRAGVSLSVLRKHIYGQQLSPLLVDFPQPCARGRKLLWLDVDIDRWLEAQSTYPRSTSPAEAARSAAETVVQVTNRPGRPRKSAPIAPGGL
jgi:predicted DNA-binding transcriptional regulator AlpA